MGKNSYICGKCKNCGTYLCNTCDGTDRFIEDLGKYKKTVYTNVRKETTMNAIDKIKWRVEGIELNNKYLDESSLQVTLNGYPTDLRVTQHDLMTLDRVLEQKLNGRPKMNYYPANPCYGITKPRPFAIKDVIFNDPATIVFWEDGTKTVVKAKDETFDPEKGLAMAFSKKMFGNEGNYYNNFKQWLEPYYEKEEEDFKDFLKNLRESTAKLTTSLAALKIPACNIQMEMYKKLEEEAAKYNPVEEAYMQLKNFLEGNGSLDLEEIRGYLAEALE